MILKTSLSSAEQQDDDNTKTEFPLNDFEKDTFEQQTTTKSLPSSVQDVSTSEKPIGK